jgi:MFS family permease
MPGGSFIGALVSGYLTDKLGRRRAIQIGCFIWIIGSIISCASQNIGMLIAGRLINGFAVGICSAQVPVYVSELAPPSKRGRVVGSQQWAITWGILIMVRLSRLIASSRADFESSTTSLTGAFTWTAPKPSAYHGLCKWSPPSSSLSVSCSFPNLPDGWEETQAVLTLVHGKGDPNSPFVKLEMDEIKQMIDFERQNADVSVMELFKPRMLNRLHIGIFTQIWSQLTGMNVMMYYIT